MEQKIGKQIKLPFRRAMQISLRGIRIRFGRSLVTVSGVVLGIAFLMSNLTGQLIKQAIAKERAQRDTVNMMLALVRAEIGSVSGKKIAVAVCGALSDVDRLLLDQVVAAGPESVRGLGFEMKGVTSVPVESLGQEAALLLVLGNATRSELKLSALSAGMRQRVVLDSVEDRVYAGPADSSVRRDPFFGKESDEQIQKAQQQARAERFRTIWIVGISLLVTVLGVANALLMSVTERFREIGTMKCLGALSAFIRTLFLIESSLIGLAGSLVGVVVGALLPMIAYSFAFRFGLVFGSMPYGPLFIAAAGAVVVGTLLAVLAAIYPARFASRMVPASALRSTV
ncbi:MAG: FtsX-like permease family protein [bacterium]